MHKDVHGYDYKCFIRRYANQQGGGPPSSNRFYHYFKSLHWEAFLMPLRLFIVFDIVPYVLYRKQKKIELENYIENYLFLKNMA